MYKLKIILFCLFVPIWQGLAQTWDMAPQPPDVTTFSRYGNYPISYYTGTPQISIPIFTIQEKDIEIPLSLNYGGNGVRVADESTWVGLGWNLYPGGYISRIVIGSQYDNHDSDVYNALLDKWNSDDESNYLRRYDSNNTTRFAYTGSEIEGVPATLPITGPYIDLPNFLVSSFASWARQAQYFQPDLYAFSFLGYSGKFYINPETNEPIILDKKDQILFEKNNTPWDPEVDGWKVTLPNGIVVFFEDQEKVQQMVTSCTSGAPSLTWKITRIKLTNNEEINFLYEGCSYQTASIANVDIHSFEDDYDYELNRYHNYGSFNLPFPTVDCNYNRSPVPVINELKVLRHISTPRYMIDFNRVSGEAKPRLESIEIYEKSVPATKSGFKFSFAEFKKAEQVWNQFGTSGTQLEGEEAPFIKYKLTKLQKYGIKNGVTKLENPYEFYYTEDIGLPSILSYAQDYWGYYNGKHENTGLIPDESQMYANEGYFPVVSLPDRRSIDDLRARANANRGVSINHMIQGSLNKIVYPTKGYTKFTFEPHEFYLSDLDDYILMADEIIFNSASGHYENNYSGSQNAPSKGAGLRINEIINYDGDGSFISRTKFDYQGSGLLLEPVHFWRVERYLQAPNSSDIFYYKTWNASGSNYNQSYAIPNSVGYSSVLVTESDSETDHAGEKLNGSTFYNFHNYETLYNPQVSKVSFSYLDARNGFPRLIKYRDTTNSLIKSVDYEYKKIESSMFLSMAAKHIHDHSDVLLNVFKIEYTPLTSEWWKKDFVTETVDGIVQKTTFEYSTDGLANLISKKTETSEGTILESKYKYPLDYNLSGISESTSDPEYYALRVMVQKNIANTPVEIVELKNNKLISGRIITYKLFHGIPHIYQTFLVESAFPLEINPTSNQNDDNIFDWSYTITPYGVNGPGYLLKDNFYSANAKTTLKNYDEKGNLIEYSLSDGQYGSYLWGYDQTLPVAKIVNASYSDVESVLGVNFHAGSSSLTNANEQNLRNNTSLSKALITTYTYDPLIGITTITDPNGLKQTFNYDVLGRLKLIKDNEGKITENYKYHYINQPHP